MMSCILYDRSRFFTIFYRSRGDRTNRMIWKRAITYHQPIRCKTTSTSCDRIPRGGSILFTGHHAARCLIVWPRLRSIGNHNRVRALGEFVARNNGLTITSSCYQKLYNKPTRMRWIVSGGETVNARNYNTYLFYDTGMRKVRRSIPSTTNTMLERRANNIIIIIPVAVVVLLVCKSSNKKNIWKYHDSLAPICVKHFQIHVFNKKKKNVESIFFFLSIGAITRPLTINIIICTRYIIVKLFLIIIYLLQ